MNLNIDLFQNFCNLTFFPQHFLGLAGKWKPKYFNKKILNIPLGNLIFNVIVLLCFIIITDNLLEKNQEIINFLETIFNMNNNVVFTVISLSLKHKKNKVKIPNGPHIKPIWLNNPIRIYDNIDCQKNLIGSNNKKRSIIYQWINLITGKMYVGSA